MEAIPNIFINHFENIFLPGFICLQEDLFFNLQGRVNDNMNAELTKPFTKEEIHSRLFSMHLDKALGEDGLPASFFQNFWDIVEDLVSHVCLNFLNGEGSLGSLNHTLLTLVPKIKDPKEVTNFRLIGLCMVIYKLILKTVANRLKVFLPSLIFMEQSAFVPGRQILDNVLVAFETMHIIKSQR